MGQAQINVRTRACSRTSIARTRQAALTHNVRGKELNGGMYMCFLDASKAFDRVKHSVLNLTNSPVRGVPGYSQASL